MENNISNREGPKKSYTIRSMDLEQHKGDMRVRNKYYNINK